MRGAPLNTREEIEAGQDAEEDAHREAERGQAWKNYNSVRPRGDIDRGAAFQAGFAAGVRYAARAARRNPH